MMHALNALLLDGFAVLVLSTITTIVVIVVAGAVGLYAKAFYEEFLR